MINVQKYISQPLSKKICDIAKKNNIKLPESEYCWCKNFWLTTWNLKKTEDCLWNTWAKADGEFRRYKAYDTSELGEILLKAKGDFQIIYGFLHNTNEQYSFIEVIHGIEGDKGITKRIGYETEANARGKLLIYLIKNKLV